MHRVAFLSMVDTGGFCIYDELAHEPLRALGVKVETHPWRTRRVDWSRFEAVVIRSTWDYHKDPEAFVEALSEIASCTRLFNALDLVRWNLDKRYLEDLERAGVAIVPTRFAMVSGAADLGAAITELGRPPEVVVKPTVSANADHTYRIPTQDREALARAARALAGRAVIVQPFMARIADEGELSLFYFDGTYSHAIRKTPRRGDFRVQEEHGGRLARIDPEPELLEAGMRAMAAIETNTLYARIDLVRSDTDDFLLMEAELIEPSLYFQLDPGAAGRFAAALARRLVNDRPYRQPSR